MELTKEKLDKIPKRRNGYYYLKELDNEPYPSVTTILKVISKDALVYWAAKRMFEVLSSTPEKLSDMQSAISEAIYKPKASAGDEGSKAHEVIDHELRGMKYDRASLSPKVATYIGGYESFIKAFKPKYIHTEATIYSEKYKYAGQLDAICEIGNEVWLIDYKTSNGVYAETGLQLVAYANAEKVEDRKTGKYVDMPKIDKMGVVHLKNDGTFNFKEFNDKFNSFLAVYAAWKWWKGVKE